MDVFVYVMMIFDISKHLLSPSPISSMVARTARYKSKTIDDSCCYNGKIAYEIGDKWWTYSFESVSLDLMWK